MHKTGYFFFFSSISSFGDRRQRYLGLIDIIMWWMFVCTFIQRFWIAVAKCKSIQQYLKVLEIVSVRHTCTHTLSAHKCTSQMYGQCDDSAYVWNTSSTSFRISRHLDSTFHKILHKYHTQKKERMTLFEHSHRFHILFKLKLCILSAGFFFW